MPEEFERNEMILASAGSGKTYQLSNRIAGIVMRGVEPRRVAALTFTRKAAGEFADAVVEKLARAAGDEEAARGLAGELGVEAGQAEFRDRLAVLVRELPRVFLGTLDSFFARVVRGFQYELGLTGGAFELVQGAALRSAQDEVLGGLLGEALRGKAGEGFLESFKRATFGREEQRVAELLGKFVGDWHGRFMEVREEEAWGGEPLAAACGPDDWIKVKAGLLRKLQEELASVPWTDKRQSGAAEKMVEQMETFVPVDGGGEFKSGMIAKVLEVWEEVESGSATIKMWKEVELPAGVCEALRETVRSMARAVFEGHLLRTRAVWEVMASYERRYARELRERGKLAFDDVKRLMGEWARSEEARLRREWVDFRLDGRFDHWLLDEFQDTSRTDWQGVEPLVDEAAMDPEEQKSVFVVGDRKQGIFAWRGGDVGLFDEVITRYGVKPRPMPVSERSGPEVLALVNAVCGNREVMGRLFPEKAVRKWDFEEHRPSPRVEDRHGYAEVREVEGDLGAQCDQLGALLTEIAPRRRGLSCGVLVRENKEVTAVADDLRARGFEVVEEGKRAPATDNAFGVAVLDLFRWLANPGDRFAREHLWMSPVGAVLEDWLGTPRARCWEAAQDMAATRGWAGWLAELVERVGKAVAFSEFGRRRALELVRGLEEAAALEDGSAAAGVRFLEGWEVEQGAGAGTIQVMTIHKSKGLGFDVVIVPSLSDAKIPDFGRLQVLEQSGGSGALAWLVQSPPRWVQRALPSLRAAADDWGAGQAYEGMCLLYVALTRAKVAQYVFVPPAARAADSDKPSLANWVREACPGAQDAEEVLARWGDPEWCAAREPAELPAERKPAGLARPEARRERRTPSGEKKEHRSGPSGTGRKIGTEVHRLFEQIGWLAPGEVPRLPRSQAGAMVEESLREETVHAVFEQGSETRDLYREQPVEVLLDGKWMSGVVDRLHVARNEQGRVGSCEVIDFKTDRVQDREELRARYAGQMQAYREALAQVFEIGPEMIRCLLVSTSLQAVLEVGA